MKDLQLFYEDLNFKNVQTYIQSGNVVFETAKSPVKTLEEKIGKKIFQQYKFEVPVIIRTKEEMETG